MARVSGAGPEEDVVRAFFGVHIGDRSPHCRWSVTGGLDEARHRFVSLSEAERDDLELDLSGGALDQNHVADFALH
jgi:hypothetical protein